MEKKYKKKIILFLIGIVIGVFGFASSFFMYINTPSAIEINYDVGDKYLDVNNNSTGLIFTSIDESVYLEKVIPTLDKFGVLEKGFSFSIKNTGEDAKYELKLADVDSTIRNSNIRYELTKNNKVLSLDTLADDGILETSSISKNETINYTIKLWLDYNSEVKIGKFNKKIAINSIGDEVTEKINKPELVNGMIPVYYDNDSNSWYKANQDNESGKWYSYSDKKWANAITVNKEKRNYYFESGIGTKIENNDINSMWVWIPRFNYLQNEIDFVNTNQTAYQAFSFNNHELSGFWFSKFEAGMKEDSECISSSLTTKCNNSNNLLYYVPNYPFATKMTMANMFYAIRKMEFKNNIYGFDGTGTKLNNDGMITSDKNNIDIHMIKNSEWQAVLLLANSKYGNTKIVNNNSTFTGKSYYENSEYEYNVSLKGEKASTTGNVYGIYDMAGGKREYVMINTSEVDLFNKKSNSGFTTKVKECYFDNEFNDLDTTLKLKDTISKENMLNNEPITRGGYKNTGNIFNLYGTSDYINKVSVETNSRASIIVLKEKNDEKKES